MDVKLLLELAQRYGISTVLAGFLFWKHYLEPKQRRKKGTFVSYTDMDARIDNISMRTSANQNTCDKREEDYQEFLKEEAEEDIMITEHDGRIAKLESDTGHLFNQTGTLFGDVKDLSAKIDKKVDDLSAKFDRIDLKRDAQYDNLIKLIVERK